MRSKSVDRELTARELKKTLRTCDVFSPMRKNMAHLRAVHEHPRVQRLLKEIDLSLRQDLSRPPYEGARLDAYIRFYLFYLEHGPLSPYQVNRYFGLQSKLRRLMRHVSKKLIEESEAKHKPRNMAVRTRTNSPANSNQKGD